MNTMKPYRDTFMYRTHKEAGRRSFMTCELFFFNDTATTEIYTLSLHDALPISARPPRGRIAVGRLGAGPGAQARRDRKSTRLNSSHSQISYAVFCLKKKTRSAAAASAP